MKKITMLAALFLTLTAVFLGCDEGMTVVKPVLPDAEIQEPRITEAPVTMGEVKVPEESVVPDHTPSARIRYYRDAELTVPVTDSVELGTVLYVQVTFSEEVPVVIADDKVARPSIFFTVRPAPERTDQTTRTAQYRMKPRGSDLQSGDAMPYQDSFLCKYVVGTEDFAKHFFTHTNASEGNWLEVILYSEGWVSWGECSLPVRKNPNDFVGVVCAILQNPVADVTVTIITGPRSGEQVITNRNGHYIFSNIATNELHLRVEKEYFEPKEVIIYRDRQTILANGDAPKFPDRSKDPGLIYIGQRWPDEIRPILQNTLLVHDLLYYEGSLQLRKRGSSATYSGYDGMIQLNTGLHSQSTDPAGKMLQALAHEIAHAHQHALVSIDGSALGTEWENTPEGQAFAEAREKDLEEFGKVAPYDTEQHYIEWLAENAAEVCAYYWIAYPRKMVGYAKLEDVAPNRFKWAEEWLGGGK